MRYVIQIIVMLSDILIIAVAAWLLYKAPSNVTVWIIVFLTFRAWRNQGGFIAWKPSNVRMFMREAKRIGL